MFDFHDEILGNNDGRAWPACPASTEPIAIESESIARIVNYL
jgi:hypothetical protein